MSDASGEARWWREVAAGLGGGHAGHGVAQPDPLVERGEDAESHPSPQGRLPDQQAGEGAVESMSWLVSYAELGVTHLMPRRRLCRGDTGVDAFVLVRSAALSGGSA